MNRHDVQMGRHDYDDSPSFETMADEFLDLASKIANFRQAMLDAYDFVRRAYKSSDHGIILADLNSLDARWTSHQSLYPESKSRQWWRWNLVRQDGENFVELSWESGAQTQSKLIPVKLVSYFANFDYDAINDWYIRNIDHRGAKIGSMLTNPAWLEKLAQREYKKNRPAMFVLSKEWKRGGEGNIMRKKIYTADNKESTYVVVFRENTCEVMNQYVS